MNLNFTKIFKILFLILLISSGCQPPLGTYSTLPNLSGSAYTFKKGNRFEYHYANCITWGKGMGTYTIDKNTIRFNFESYPDAPAVDSSFFPVLTAHLTDRVEIHIEALDGIGEDLIGCAIKISQNGQIQQGAITDIRGRATMVQVWNDLPLTLEAVYTGIVPLKTHITAPGRYTWKFISTDTPQFIETPQTRFYQLIKFNKKVLIMKVSDEREYVWYRW